MVRGELFDAPHHRGDRSSKARDFRTSLALPPQRITISLRLPRRGETRMFLGHGADEQGPWVPHQGELEPEETELDADPDYRRYHASNRKRNGVSPFS